MAYSLPPFDFIVDIVLYPGTVARGCVVDVSRDGDTYEKVAWKDKKCFRVVEKMS